MATNAELAALARNELINNLGRPVSAQEYSMLDGLLEGASAGGVFSLAAYGATGDGSTDDGPAIRLALAAAYAAGGGIVEGVPGKNYRVVPLLVTGASYTAWRAIAMREGVTLDFKGSTVTVVAQTAGNDGCVISANGTESATTDYGAEGNWTIRNAVFATTDATSKTTGNVLVFLRCHGAKAENISTSTAFAYHIIEFNNCRAATARNITINHETGVGVAGGPYPEIQFDTGNPAAPVGSYAHTGLVEDVLLENVQMRDIGVDPAKVRRVELGHGLATYRRITIRGGYYAGLDSGTGANDAAIMDVNSVFANTYEDILIDGVTFEHDSMGSGGGCACFRVPDSANVTLRGLEVRNCRFTGNYRFGVQVGSSSTTVFTAASAPKRSGIHIHDNYFAPGQVAPSAGQTGTTRVICVQGCQDAVIEYNYELSPATETNLTSNAYNSISACNNYSVVIRNNAIRRQQAALADMANGDNNGIYIRIDEALATSGTQEIVVDIVGNVIYGVHRVGLYESASPGSWAAGGYARIRGLRARNLFHTAGTVANQINLPIGESVPLKFALGDETTSMTTGTKVTFRAPYGLKIYDARLSLTTAATGASLFTVNILESGVSIFSTKLTTDASEKTSTTAVARCVISDFTIADDAEMTIAVDVIGSTIAGAGAKVSLVAFKASI